MLDTFKARLKAKSTASGANLSQKRIDAIADRLHKKFPDLTEEKDHDEKLDERYDEAELKEIAALDDHQRAKEAKDKKDKENKDKKEADAAKPKSKDDDPPEEDWKQAMDKQIKELSDKLAQSEKKELQSRLYQKFLDKLKDEKIPLSFAKGRTIESEDQIETLLTEVKADWTEVSQEFSNNGLYKMSGTPAGGTANNGKATKEEIGSLVDKILPKF